MSFYCDINRPITNCDPRDNNALIRGNLCEHRHISLKTRFLELYVFVANSMGLTLTTLTLQLAAKAIEFGKITQKMAITPFKVIQRHRFGYQSKAHMRLPISD